MSNRFGFQYSSNIQTKLRLRFNSKMNKFWTKKKHTKFQPLTKYRNWSQKSSSLSLLPFVWLCSFFESLEHSAIVELLKYCNWFDWKTGRCVLIEWLVGLIKQNVFEIINKQSTKWWCMTFFLFALADRKLSTRKIIMDIALWILWRFVFDRKLNVCVEASHIFSRELF